MESGFPIRLAALPLGKSRLAGEMALQLVDAAGEKEVGWARAECEVDHLGTRIHFQGSASGEVESHCHRCLEAYRRPIAAPFEATLQRTELTGDTSEVEFVPESVVEYDLGPRIREAILLEEPLQSWCTPACRGLCPQCGANRNREICGCEAPRDPRWAPLAALESRDDEGKA
jgi:uncharacterized protein